MPELPPDLHQEIVDLLKPLRQFRLPDDRVEQLEPFLGEWTGRHDLDWTGGSYTFFQRFVRVVPGPELSNVLQNLSLLGEEDRLRAADLRRRVGEASARVSATAEHPLKEYHQLLARELSGGRWQLDSRFVHLTVLVDQGPEAQGVRFVQDSQARRYEGLAALLHEREEQAIVLLGGPGSGKTTLLRRLELEKAWAALDGSHGQKPATPFFLSLNGYRGADPGEPPPQPDEWMANEWKLRHPNLPPFERLFEEGSLLLLLDGLNEMPHRDKEDYRARIGTWQAFLRRAQHRGNTFVFSCRSLDYSASLSSEALPVPQVRVEPLSPEQIHAFLELHLVEEAQAATVWEELRQDPQQLALFGTPFFLQLLVDQVLATGEMRAGQAALLTGLIRRALHREIVERQHRLFKPDLLLSEDDTVQVIHHAWAGPYDLPAEGLLVPHLASLAYAMQDGRQASEAGQVRVPERTARDLLALPQAADIVAAGIQLNVLDKDVATREVAFYHQLVQEYFAARVVAQAPEPQRVAVAWRVADVVPTLEETLAALEAGDPLPALPATGWEETTVLAAALVPEPEGFVAELIEANLPLAARCAAAVEVAVPPKLVDALQQALIERISDPEADLRARIAAAEALGELGDPRFERRSGPHGDYLLPPLVAVPAGVYPIGDDASDYEDEKPEHTLALAAFEIGVFPVTNAEYALFIAAGAYEDEQWWETEAAHAWLRGEGGNQAVKQDARNDRQILQDFSDDLLRRQEVSPEQIEFWLWLKHAKDGEIDCQYDIWYPTTEAARQPAFWDDSRFNHAAQPVVGICWYEARAYCAWLAAQTGRPYRLPAEVEWEAAARGSQGRQYAFAGNFDPSHCNTFESHIRRTTPVGVFPGGQTPEGIADLTGNAWEWTSTLWGEQSGRPSFAYPYDAGDGREDPENALARRVVRGGSWSYARNVARAAYRGSYHPDNRNVSIGFRVVCRPPSQNEH